MVCKSCNWPDIEIWTGDKFWFDFNEENYNWPDKTLHVQISPRTECHHEANEKRKPSLFRTLQKNVSLSANQERRGGEEQVWTNDGRVFKLEEEVMLRLKLTSTCLTCNKYKTLREMFWDIRKCASTLNICGWRGEMWFMLRENHAYQKDVGCKPRLAIEKQVKRGKTKATKIITLNRNQTKARKRTKNRQAYLRTNQNE